MRVLSVAVLTALSLSGCAVVVDPVPTTPGVTVEVPVVPAADACGASRYQGFVGQLSPAIRLPAGTDLRSYRTGDPVTMDFVPTRINFEYDRRGALVRVSCG